MLRRHDNPMHAHLDYLLTFQPEVRVEFDSHRRTARVGARVFGSDSVDRTLARLSMGSYDVTRHRGFNLLLWRREPYAIIRRA